ncbi:hypothetical protein niasHS_010271 [Heterodera schachtii]|uniref:Uncharacterized protein n=1 Tax=Heterodera schachtii TaxID=97005 RepID=A0ABD2J3G7_HETSC
MVRAEVTPTIFVISNSESPRIHDKIGNYAAKVFEFDGIRMEKKKRRNTGENLQRNWIAYLKADGQDKIGCPYQCKLETKPLTGSVAMEDFPIDFGTFLDVFAASEPVSNKLAKLRGTCKAAPKGFPVMVELPVYPTIKGMTSDQTSAEHSRNFPTAAETLCEGQKKIFVGGFSIFGQYCSPEVNLKVTCPKFKWKKNTTPLLLPSDYKLDEEEMELDHFFLFDFM